MTTLAIDIETYNSAELPKVGVYKYVEDPTFEILLFGYSLDRSPVKVIDLKHGQSLPAEVHAALADSSVIKTAFNAAFERVCLEKYLQTKLPNWECTMVQAWRCGINGGLDTVGAAVGLPPEAQKIKEGKRLIRKFCRPHKATQLDLPGLTDSGDWALFIEYCRRDVEVETAIRNRLSRFTQPSWEQDLYALDQRINDNGIQLDPDLINGAITIDETLTDETTARYKRITGLDNPNSLPDIKNFIRKKTGKNITSLTKSNLDKLIWELADYPEVAEVLKIRKLLSKTSTAKYQAMQAMRMSDGRCRGILQYYGARTGRWAGRLIQVHNLPRNNISDLNSARELISMGDYQMLNLCYNSAPEVLSQCLRTAIIPDTGYKYIVADYSAIEARVLAWLAGESWVLEAFRAGKDIYCETASKMFNVPVEKHGVNADLRQKGKVATLALGYQGGSSSLISMGALNMGLSEEELPELVNLWRTRNPHIVHLWTETDAAVKTAIEDRVPVDFAGGKCRAAVNRGILWITLPSGRKLAYCRPRVVPHHEWAGATKIIYHERALTGSSWISRDLCRSEERRVGKECRSRWSPYH